MRKYQSWQEFDRAIWPEGRDDDDTNDRDRLADDDVVRLQRETLSASGDLAAAKRERRTRQVM